VTALAIHARDITETKKAEEALRESEKRYTKAEQIGHFGHWHRNLLEKKGTWSNETYRIFGVNPDQFQPTWENFLNFVHPSDREFLKSEVETAISQCKPFDYYYRIIRPDGSERFIHSIAELSFKESGQPIGLTGTVHDITERKQTEEALRESEYRYGLIFNGSREAIFITGTDAKFTEVNDAASVLTGYSKAELKRMSIPDLHKKVDLHAYETYFKSIMAGKPVVSEAKILRKNGVKVDTEFSNTRINISGIPFMHSVARDITDRKQAEKALKQAHDELERRVEERTRELEIQKKSLEELNTAMKVLLIKREEDKTEVEQNVMTNVKELIEPYFGKINETKLDDHQKAFLNILESNLNEIVSPFTRRLSLKYLNLTPKEIQIVNMIKIGYPSKKIAKVMKISPRTVETHRKNIRGKIGLGKKRANLRSYLLAHEQ